MDYTSKKRILTEKFEANKKQIEAYQQATSALIIENAKISGQFNFIEELEKEVIAPKKKKE